MGLPDAQASRLSVLVERPWAAERPLTYNNFGTVCQQCSIRYRVSCTLLTSSAISCATALFWAVAVVQQICYNLFISYSCWKKDFGEASLNFFVAI